MDPDGPYSGPGAEWPRAEAPPAAEPPPGAELPSPADFQPRVEPSPRVEPPPRAAAPPVDDATRIGKPSPTRIRGKIELHHEIGRGGMAAVWLASDHAFSPPRQVAVKFMDEQLSSDPEFRARFDREASMVAGFRHENIVRVYSSGEDGSSKYIVMEYLSGGTLAAKIRDRALDSGAAIQIAAQLADALAHAHQNGIIHRDFKPGNVLFTAEGKPVLSDFGVAKGTGAEHADMTKVAMVVGAPRYMSPEQARADMTITDRSDVYSFGVTLFEMLTRHVPPADVLAAGGGADLIKTHLAKQPAAVRALIQSCWSAKPAARPSAAHCRSVLARARSRDAGEAPKPRRIAYAAGFALALALGGGAYWWWPAGGNPPPVTERESAVSPVEAAAPSPTGRFSVTRREPQEAKIYLGDAEVVGVAPLSPPPGQYRLVTVAPRFYGEVRNVDVTAGRETATTVALRPVTLPAVAELSLFYDLTEQRLDLAAIDRMADLTLYEALRLKWLRQQGDLAAVAAAQDRLRVLETHGDDRAPVTLFLDESITYDRVDETMISEWLAASSDRGDALASFLAAQAHRGSNNTAGYCRRMQLAAAAGWEVAVQQLSGDESCQGPAGTTSVEP